mmetsp:Transcript_48806/g.86960  ORF Transcript_48806/g.86960 Transcript_48806/m.86960 type:complete len:80 (-) Transcript_48806:1811-2050(-)
MHIPQPPIRTPTCDLAPGTRSQIPSATPLHTHRHLAAPPRPSLPPSLCGRAHFPLETEGHTVGTFSGSLGDLAPGAAAP